jgi:hypothetical protein
MIPAASKGHRAQKIPLLPFAPSTICNHSKLQQGSRSVRKARALAMTRPALLFGCLPDMRQYAHLFLSRK